MTAMIILIDYLFGVNDNFDYPRCEKLSFRYKYINHLGENVEIQ